ncbi:MAG: LPS export ABC transporter permease LptG [Geminicoccaceae bacterium]|nr:LPS export ABC transporter permease LptG [Geminicoccaceae bacterium]
MVIAVDPPIAAGQRRIRLSLTLSRYLARQVLIGILAILLALGTVAFVIDVVEHLRRASGKDEATFGMVLLMALLHQPFLLQKLIPFATLFGTIFSFQRLTRSQELVAARASGVSVWQFLAPALFVAAGLGVVTVVAFNPLGSAMVARYEKLEQTILSSRASLVQVAAGGLWLRQDEGEREYLIHARQMTRQPPVLERVVIFIYEDEVRFAGRIDAPSARLEAGQWVLDEPLVSGPDGKRSSEKRLVIATDLTPDRIQESFAAPETLSFWNLPAFIDSLEAVGFSAREHRLYWHGLLALPLLLSAMLLIGTTFSLRLTRRGGTSLLVMGGLGAGFLFYIMSDVVFAIGLSGRLPVILAAWTPAGIAILLGVTTLLHLEDG